MALAAGAPLILQAVAFDDTDTPLRGRALTWRIGRRLLGTGTVLSTDSLPSGHYRIILTARDRHGRKSSAVIWVSVKPELPVVGVLDAPARISAHARRVTIRR